MGFPFIKQLDETDCGAACLAMVARYYNKDVGTARIREIACTDRDGTNFLGMIKAAEELGFAAKAVKAKEKELDTELPVPFIAHVRIDEYNLYHFVVVYRVTSSRVYVGDPAQGRAKLPHDEFARLWTGAFIVAVPAPDFRENRELTGPLGRFLPLLLPFKKQFAEVFVASLLLFFFNIAQFFYIRFLLDEVLPGGMWLALHALSAAMVGVVFLRVGVELARKYVLAQVGSRIDLSIVFAYLSHLLSLPLSFFDRRKVGEVITRLDDAKRIRSVLSGATLSLLMDSFMIVGIGAFLFSQSPMLTVVILATVPGSTIVVVAFHKPFRENNRKAMKLHARSHSHLVETMRSIFTVKAMNHEQRSFLKGETRFLDTIRQRLKLEHMANAQGSFIGLIEGCGRIALFWMGGYLILQGELSFGQLISFSMLMRHFTGPMKRLLTMQPELQSASVAARRLVEIMDLDPEQAGGESLTDCSDLRGKIEFRNVDFQYGTRRRVLKDISFTVDPGQRLGIVGGSGSGKSTLIKLLLRFYDPIDGNILIDDIDIRDLNTRELRGSVGYVPQEVTLFGGTVYENLVMHHPECTMQDVVVACAKAHLLDFINELPDRFQTEIGEAGCRLSGGERQRFAIARALVGNPGILVFDEATSALDSITERRVQKTIERLSQEGITTIMIAHRLSTVVSCDRILVMRAGEVEECGTHGELIAREDGTYASLWREQRIA